ncbi:iron ABC transporter permease [Exilibacterium tricleocarpae]|uniref:Iron ABC transporter permease n=1 Tax=Exilibacterium tricleocarpae TaxID=2591008 RepID=A0A545U4H4_9GAMM|nr:iron ABC transporter permease [Exilibacterium tricleocarpae]
MAQRRVLLLLAPTLPACFLLAVIVGAVTLPPAELAALLTGTGDPSGGASAQLIITQIRLPRALLAAIVGALLGVSGAAMQGLFRNPLADPSLLGVTAGAAAGAAVVIVLGGLAAAGLWALSLVSLGAFAGGMLAVGLVYRLATGATGTSVATMLLAGIAVTAVAGSLTSLLEFSADNAMLRRISLWRMGGLDGASYQRVTLAAAVGLIVLALLPRYSRALNALLLGESEARHLGIDVETVKNRLIVLVAAGVGVSVALAGTIAFVGLVVPHIMRLLAGPDHRYLLPASALAGAVLLLLADTLARVIIAPTELPVGLVTALLGAPFFISLLLRRHEYAMQ